MVLVSKNRFKENKKNLIEIRLPNVNFISENMIVNKKITFTLLIIPCLNWNKIYLTDINIQYLNLHSL